MKEPFAAECLTEDYECGLLIGEIGGRASFVRARDSQGQLVATREFFPAGLASAVRQKTRWLHGIALQGWERLGWSGRPLELWMRLRDRRAPLTAVVLAAAYLLIALLRVLMAAEWAGLYDPPPLSDAMRLLLQANFLALGWRVVSRMAFTAREYGLAEGVLSILRMPVGNVVAMMAGRRAVAAYLRALRSGHIHWDHTVHLRHPARDAPLAGTT
jgi:adsorption protein B